MSIKTVRLGDICDIVSGGTPSRSKIEYWQDGTIPWIKIGNIKGKHVAEADEHITKAGLDGSSAKMLSKGTILYTIFATLGEVGILDIEACTNQAIAGISIREPSEIISDYLYYYLKSKKNYVNGIGRGVAQNNINMSILRDFSLPLPTIGQQNEIVIILDKVSSVIALRQQQLSTLDNLIKARFVEMFGNPFDTLKWDVKELKEVSESMVDGSNVNPDFYESEGDVLFLRIQNVWRNEFRLDDSVYISKDINKEQYYDTSLKTGDLLITKIGRYYTKDSSLGRVSVYRGKDDCANYSNNIMCVRLNDSVNSEFVNVLLNLDDYQSFIKRTSKGGTDKRALSKSLIGSYPIIMPPKELQDEFVDFINQVNKSKAVVNKALNETQLLFDSLMQQYFG